MTNTTPEQVAPASDRALSCLDELGRCAARAMCFEPTWSELVTWLQSLNDESIDLLSAEIADEILDRHPEIAATDAKFYPGLVRLQIRFVRDYQINWKDSGGTVLAVRAKQGGRRFTLCLWPGGLDEETEVKLLRVIGRRDLN